MSYGLFLQMGQLAMSVQCPTSLFVVVTNCRQCAQPIMTRVNHGDLE